MKKKAIAAVSLSVVIILLILFLPIRTGLCKDGGTRVYSALTYKVVVWNRLLEETKEDGSAGELQTYHKTSVFWFPDNRKSIDELWRIERNDR